jgi:hypothetical protein
VDLFFFQQRGNELKASIFERYRDGFSKHRPSLALFYAILKSFGHIFSKIDASHCFWNENRTAFI